MPLNPAADQFIDLFLCVKKQNKNAKYNLNNISALLPCRNTDVWKDFRVFGKIFLKKRIGQFSIDQNEWFYCHKLVSLMREEGYST